MRAMILAAGRGERLRPLTDKLPKPLVEVGGKPLMLWHIEKLKAIGISEIVVNSAHLSEKIVDYLKDGSAFGVKITHSAECPGGLETAGGIIKALPHLGDEFLVVNGDTFIDADYEDFLSAGIPEGMFGRVFLTENPPHNLKGDFSLHEDGTVSMGPGYTFSGAALYRAEAFSGFKEERLPLRPFFERWTAQGKLAGALINGKWFDVGTYERLENVRAYLMEKSA